MAQTVLIKWINVIKENWKLIILSFFIPAIISLGVSLLLTKQYKSSVKALSPEVATGGTFLQTPLGSIASGGEGTIISTQAVISILNSNLIADEIVKKFSLKELFNKKTERLAREFFKEEMLSVAMDENTGVITITIKSPYNDLNPKIANSLIPLVDSANARLNLTSENKILKVIEWAEPALKKYFPKYSINTIAGGIVGIIFVIIYLYFREDLSLIDD